MAAILGLFAFSFAIALSGALMPGPVLTVTISQALGRGARAGPLVICGHGIAELALVSLVAAGLGSRLRGDTVVGIIGLVGGLVLVAMALAMVRGSAEAARQAVSALRATAGQRPSGRPGGGALRCVLLGSAASVSNPYWTLWWVTVGLSLITRALRIGPVAVGAFYVGHILADLGWYWAVASAVSRGSRGLTVPGYRGLLLACAILLFGLGAYFGITGAVRLAR